MSGLATAKRQTEELERVLTTRDIHCRYQPIVDLQTMEVTAYEALARGPRDSELSRPMELFSVAERAGLTTSLDRLCRSAALEGAAGLGHDEPVPLFVNVEAESVGEGELFDDRGKEMLASGLVRVTVELTERALSTKPAELIRTVAWLRERGVGIALDDVGADERSVALIPFVTPDVVKLDLRAVSLRPPREAAAIINAVWAEAERTDSVILAEGVETEEDVGRAIALGARFGQGWLFGHPQALPEDPPLRKGGMRTLRRAAPLERGTPFETVSERREPQRATKAMLLERSLHLEEQAAGLGPEGALLSTFQSGAYFTPATAERYAQLGAELAFVAAFGCDMPRSPAPGVRGVSIGGAETLGGEWNVIVLGPHFAGAFVARDLGDEVADRDRRFEFCMTYDRDLVIEAARSLMSRVSAA